VRFKYAHGFPSSDTLCFIQPSSLASVHYLLVRTTLLYPLQISLPLFNNIIKMVSSKTFSVALGIFATANAAVIAQTSLKVLFSPLTAL
jgi:hypothetical protein